MIIIITLKITKDIRKLAPANKIGIFDITNFW